jgi:predicted nuclease of restriction endonuclease-like (RecB) superfamily
MTQKFKSVIEESKNYLQILETIKFQIKSAQVKAHLAVNKEMLILYWQIGKTIIEKQEKEGWGTKITRRLSEDLSKEFIHMTGFSYTNINYMLKFSRTYSDLLIFHQAGEKLKSDPVYRSDVASKEQIFYFEY